MNLRPRFRARRRRLALLGSLLLVGLLIVPEYHASAAQTASRRVNGAGQPNGMQVLAATSRSNRAAASQPNLYDLKDAANHTHISYSTDGVDGRPHLDYTDQRLHRSFAGKEIRVLPSEIGTLVTVTLEQVPDLHTITFTLLVPELNLRPAQATLTTTAILTTQHTSIGGPALVKGALQTYRVLTLQGTARIVLF